MARVQPKKDAVQNQENIPTETVVISIEVPKSIADKFQDVVEINGKSVGDILYKYIQKYIWKQGELQRNRKKRRESICNKIS